MQAILNTTTSQIETRHGAEQTHTERDMRSIHHNQTPLRNCIVRGDLHTRAPEGRVPHTARGVVDLDDSQSCIVDKGQFLRGSHVASLEENISCRIYICAGIEGPTFKAEVQIENLNLKRQGSDTHKESPEYSVESERLAAFAESAAVERRKVERRNENIVKDLYTESGNRPPFYCASLPFVSSHFPPASFFARARDAVLAKHG